MKGKTERPTRDWKLLAKKKVICSTLKTGN